MCDVNILIVEDNDYKYLTIEKAIVGINESIHIDHAKTRNEARRHLCDKNNDYDLIILDMQFPNMNGDMIHVDAGYEFANILNIRKVNIPIIFCSSEMADVEWKELENVKDYILYNSSVYMEPIIQEAIIKTLNV